MVFATLGFYITIWFPKPAHRKAVSRYLQAYPNPFHRRNFTKKLSKNLNYSNFILTKSNNKQ